MFIIGIILLISFLFYAQVDVEKEPQSQQTADFSEHVFFMEKCMEDKAATSIVTYAFTGEFFEKKAPSIQITLLKFPYYLFEGENYAPTKETIEEELEKAMQSHGALCKEEFEQAFGSTIASEFGSMGVKATITDQNVLFAISYPMTFTRGSSKKTIEAFNPAVDVNLMPILNFITEFTSQDIMESDGICITCLADVAEKYKLEATAEVFEKTALFELHQEGDIPITWIFANEYT